MPGRVHEYVDFHAPAPAAARPDMWARPVEGGGPRRLRLRAHGRVNDLGYQSVCVPAACAPSRHPCAPRAPALGEIWSRRLNGRKRGWPSGRPSASGGRTRARWARAPSPERLASAGRPGALLPSRRHARASGDLVVNHDLGQILALIAKTGSSCSTRARSQRHRRRTFAGHKRLIALEDLPRIARRGPRRSRQLPRLPRAAHSPPGGGVMLLEMLNVLERFDLTALGHNTPDYVRIVGGDEARDDRQRPPRRRSGVHRRALDRLAPRRTPPPRGRDRSRRPRPRCRARAAATARDTTHVSVVDARAIA